MLIAALRLNGGELDQRLVALPTDATRTCPGQTDGIINRVESEVMWLDWDEQASGPSSEREREITRMLTDVDAPPIRSKT